MAKVTLLDLSVLTSNESGAISLLNQNWDLIEAAMENTLSLDGTSPNSMAADFDLNSNDLLNGGALNGTTLTTSGLASVGSLTVNGVSLDSQVTAAAASAAAALVSENAAAASAAAALVSENAAAASAAATNLPSSLSGQALNFLRVNAGETGYEHIEPTEYVEDVIGAMLGGTQTGITVTYQDGSDDIDFVTDVTLTGTETLTNKTLTDPTFDNDLLINSGGALNWGSGDITATHSTNLLEFAGGDLAHAAGLHMVLGGSTVERHWSDEDFSVRPKLTVTSTDTEAFIGVSAFTSAASTRAGRLSLARSRGSTIDSFTAVQDNDTLGVLLFEGTDGGEFIIGASITGRVDGTVGNDDIPSELIFGTTPSGDYQPTYRWRISPTGHLEPMANATYDIGSTTNGINDLHFGSGSIINFGGGATITDGSAVLNFAGASYDFISPTDNDTAFFQGADASTGTRVTIQGTSANAVSGNSEPVLQILNAGGSQVAGIRVDGLIFADQMGSGDEKAWALLDENAEFSNAPRGMNFRDSSILGWSSTQFWWQDKDVIIARGGADQLTIRTTTSDTDRVHVSAGLWMEGATGGDQGAGTINATDLYGQRAFIGSSTDVEFATESGKINPHYQQNSTAFDGATFGISRWNNDVAPCARIVLGKSRGGAVNTNVIVNDDDRLGSFNFAGDDGSGFEVAASIYGEVDGTPGAGDMPGRLVFAVTADGASDTTEAARIDNQRNLLIGGTATATSSVGNLHLFNGTAPTASVTNGVILYAEDVTASSELKVRDEAGNITTLSPHNFDLIPEGPSEDMAWSYYSERDGKAINIDMLKAVRLLEKITGEQLVYEDSIE